MSRRAVIVIAPAWHSCGSYQVFKAQIDAYMALGFETYFLAVSPTMLTEAYSKDYWNYYLRMTPDIRSTVRGEAYMNNLSKIWPSAILNGIEARWRTVSYWRTLPARLARMPYSVRKFVTSNDVKIIHCNHYFNLPIAKKIKSWTKGAKIVCETHDIQSRHMITSDPVHPLTGIIGDYASYLSDELRCCEDADELIHLNDQEYGFFQRMLPQKIHHLIYPSVPRPPAPMKGALDIDFLIVASCNLPNYKSLCWFLDEVWDKKLNKIATLKIVGNIDFLFLNDSDERYKRYGDIFVGRVDNVTPWYHRTRTVLAPVTEGQGIAVKTIEAFSYGIPFLFSPLAIRGFDNQAEVKKLTGICKTAAEFKKAIRNRLPKKDKKNVRERNKAALRVYESLFAPEMYRKKISELFTS